MISEEDAWRCERCKTPFDTWEGEVRSEGEVVCPVCAANEVND